MDFILEEEMIDLVTFCMQNPQDKTVDLKKQRIKEIGQQIYSDGGLDALENMFFAIKNRIVEETGQDPSSYKALWNGITSDWNY